VRVRGLVGTGKERGVCFITVSRNEGFT
jgi:hypothetical protein